MKMMNDLLNELKAKFDKLPPLEKQAFNRENGCLIQSIRHQQAVLNKKHLELEKIAQSYRETEECKAKEKVEAKEQHLSQILSKIRRINIIAGGLQRRTEPVRYYVVLTSQIEIMFPQTKVALVKARSTNYVIGSQQEYVFALEDTKDDMDLDLDVVLLESKKRTRGDMKNDDDNEDKEHINSGIWTKAEKLAYEEAVKIHGDGNWADIAKAIGTRDRTQVKVFSRSKFAKRFKVSPTPFQVYAKAIETLSSAVEAAREHDGDATEKSHFVIVQKILRVCFYYY